MNQRPTRAAPPPAETQVADRQVEDASFQEVERPNNVPATRATTNGHSRPAALQRVETETVTLPTTGFSNLAAGIAGVMAEIKPVAKSGWNDFHKYNYARMQDLSAELTPLMGKHGIVVFQNELDRDMFDEGRAMAVRYQFTIVHKSGEIWPERPVITGVSMCRTSNGKYDDKAFNKCHTSARKYFLLSLFQIPTDDDEDADNSGSGEARPRPQGQRRPAPSPDGKMPPHLLAIVQGELPAAWAQRFKEFIAKASTVAEIDKWYDLNSVVFGKIKNSDTPKVYDELLDAMDARAAQLGVTVAKADPISSGKSGDFPGDKKMVAAPANDDIPIPLDRQLTEPERDWLMSLVDAYRQCNTAEEVTAEQESIMLPSEGSVSDHAWLRATELTNQHLDRVVK